MLCAPSLSGESFGMVLTEAFAAGTPAIASAIAGYSDVVTDGVDGVLVPPGDPQRLAEELQRAHHEPERLAAMGAAARAERPALRLAPRRRPRHRGLRAGDRGARRRRQRERVAHWAGIRPADGSPPQPAAAPALARPAPAQSGSRRRRVARRVGLGVAGVLGVGLTALAAQKIGVDNVVSSIVRSDLTWVLVACALMALSLFFRAASWYGIVRAALPNRPVRRRDVTSATMIGVLMSATLPARLGEPARAMIARAAHRPHARDLPGAARDPGLADDAQHRRPRPARRDHRLQHRPLPLQHREALRSSASCRSLLLVVVLLAPTLMRRNGNGRFARIGAAMRGALLQVRAGLAVFRDPRRGAVAAAAQLGAWAIQLAACWALFAALGLDDQAGIGAAAAVLFAVNVTAVVPATPSNIGVFQLAVISVLHTGFGDQHRRRPRLRRDPAGGRDRHRRRPRPARPGPRGPHLERPARTGSLS